MEKIVLKIKESNNCHYVPLWFSEQVRSHEILDHRKGSTKRESGQCSVNLRPVFLGSGCSGCTDTGVLLAHNDSHSSLNKYLLNVCLCQIQNIPKSLPLRRLYSGNGYRLCTLNITYNYVIKTIRRLAHVRKWSRGPKFWVRKEGIGCNFK